MDMVTPTSRQLQAERWFQITVLIGAVTNTLLSILGLLFPDATLGVLGLSEVYPNLWVRFSCVLLLLLTLFYLPGALFVRQYVICAILHIVSRFTGVLFFLTMVVVLKYSPKFLALGAYDLVFGLPSAIFLLRAFNVKAKD